MVLSLAFCVIRCILVGGTLDALTVVRSGDQRRVGFCRIYHRVASSARRRTICWTTAIDPHYKTVLEQFADFLRGQ